jgi:hypothetical protein
MIGSHIEVHCLSKEDIARVVDELVRQGVVKRAGDAGIETSVIVSLAARLKPTQQLDFTQAVVEVSHAVDAAFWRQSSRRNCRRRRRSAIGSKASETPFPVGGFLAPALPRDKQPPILGAILDR